MILVPQPLTPAEVVEGESGTTASSSLPVVPASLPSSVFHSNWLKIRSFGCGVTLWKNGRLTPTSFFLGLPVSEALADVKADLSPEKRPGGSW